MAATHKYSSYILPPTMQAMQPMQPMQLQGYAGLAPSLTGKRKVRDLDFPGFETAGIGMSYLDDAPDLISGVSPHTHVESHDPKRRRLPGEHDIIEEYGIANMNNAMAMLAAAHQTSSPPPPPPQRSSDSSSSPSSPTASPPSSPGQIVTIPIPSKPQQGVCRYSSCNNRTSRTRYGHWCSLEHYRLSCEEFNVPMRQCSRCPDVAPPGSAGGKQCMPCYRRTRRLNLLGDELDLPDSPPLMHHHHHQQQQQQPFCS